MTIRQKSPENRTAASKHQPVSRDLLSILAGDGEVREGRVVGGCKQGGKGGV